MELSRRPCVIVDVTIFEAIMDQARGLVPSRTCACVLLLTVAAYQVYMIQRLLAQSMTLDDLHAAAPRSADAVFVAHLDERPPLPLSGGRGGRVGGVGVYSAFGMLRALQAQAQRCPWNVLHVSWPDQGDDTNGAQSGFRLVLVSALAHYRNATIVVWAPGNSTDASLVHRRIQLSMVTSKRIVVMHVNSASMHLLASLTPHAHRGGTASGHLPGGNSPSRVVASLVESAVDAVSISRFAAAVLPYAALFHVGGSFLQKGTGVCCVRVARAVVSTETVAGCWIFHLPLYGALSAR